MSRVRAGVALTLWLAGCGAGPRAPTGAIAARDERPAWQQQMDVARRLAAAGSNYVLVAPDGVYVFFNSPRPFCYTYAIPGRWAAGPEDNLYVSKEGRGLVGMTFLLAGDLEGAEGATLVERAASAAAREYEKRMGRPLRDVELVPFESARPGTWRWRAAAIAEGERSVEFPERFIVDLGPDAVAQITVDGTGDDDGLARRIVESLGTTSDPGCYWSVLEGMLKSALGDL